MHNKKSAENPLVILPPLVILTHPYHPDVPLSFCRPFVILSEAKNLSALYVSMQPYLNGKAQFLSSGRTQLDTPQEQVCNACEYETKFEANIHPIGWIEQIGNGT